MTLLFEFFNVYSLRLEDTVHQKRKGKGMSWVLIDAVLIGISLFVYIWMTHSNYHHSITTVPILVSLAILSLGLGHLLTRSMDTYLLGITFGESVEWLSIFLHKTAYVAWGGFMGWLYGRTKNAF